MTKFFIPGYGTRSGEDVYVWIVRYVSAVLGCEIEPDRIFALVYSHGGRQYRAAVGQPEERTGQLVVAILRSDAYLVCTPYYGVQRGEPLRIEDADAVQVEYFEGLDNARHRFRTAVRALDGAGGALRPALLAAAETLAPLGLDDFPPLLAGEFLSLRLKLSWRESVEATIAAMTDAEVDAAIGAIRALYVDLLVPRPGDRTRAG